MTSHSFTAYEEARRDREIVYAQCETCPAEFVPEDGEKQCRECEVFERDNPPAPPSLDSAIRRMLERLPLDVRPDVLKVIKAVQADTGLRA